MQQVEVATALSGAARLDFAQPQALDSLQKLARLVGPAAALEAWSRAASSAARHGMELSVEELLEIAQHLVPQGGVVGVFGRSLATRCRAYIILRRHGG